MDTLLSLNDVGHALGGISEKSVRRLIDRGLLPRPVKILSIPTLATSDVAKFIEQQKSEREKPQS